MQLSEEEIFAIACKEGDQEKHGFIFNKDGRWSVISFARAIESALRAQADARPVATVMRNQVLCWLPGAPKLTEGTDLFTHPAVASAPGLSERMRQWIEEAVDYVNDEAMSPSLEREGRALLTRASAATVAEQSDEAASYKRMFEDAVSSLAAIDDALGIDPDESGGAAPILEAIAALKKQAAVATAALPDELKGVPETIKDGYGIWRTCTGCYESEDGHPVGVYTRSDLLDCTLGGGCAECGGIGAVWDTTDYNAMAEHFIQFDEAEEAAQQQAEPGADERAAFAKWADSQKGDPSDYMQVAMFEAARRGWMARAAQSGQRAGVPENAPYCPRCKGHGEETAMSNNGPDAEELTIACQHCGGEGSLAEAYKGVAKLFAEEQKKYLEACGKLWFERHGDAGQRAAVAEGWKLVPVEPTEEMLRAADEEDREYSLRNFGDGVVVRQGPYDHWAAMLAAAPTQQQEGEA